MVQPNAPQQLGQNPQDFTPPQKDRMSFPGMNLFDEVHVQRLGDLIDNLSKYQPSAVITICESIEIGWLQSGFPNSRAINWVEQIVKTRGCAAIALETARLLDLYLSNEDILQIVDESGKIYHNVPQLVYLRLQHKKTGNFQNTQVNPSYE